MKADHAEILGKTEISRVQVLSGAAEVGAGGDTEPGNLGSARREGGERIGTR